MKKKLFLIFILVLTLPVMASAEIREFKDNFTGGKKIQSNYQQVQYGESLYFNKLLGGIEDAYNISCHEKVFDQKDNYSQTAMELKIDENPVEYLEIKNINVQDFDGPILVRCTTVNIRYEIIEEILNAKRIALKVYKDNRIPEVFILPESILTEWKEIINTKE